jgi:hypothetical protein
MFKTREHGKMCSHMHIASSSHDETRTVVLATLPLNSHLCLPWKKILDITRSNGKYFNTYLWKGSSLTGYRSVTWPSYPETNNQFILLNAQLVLAVNWNISVHLVNFSRLGFRFLLFDDVMEYLSLLSNIFSRRNLHFYAWYRVAPSGVT